MKSHQTHRPAAVDRSADRDREQRYRRAVELIREWESDESGYDEEIWPLIEEEILERRLHVGTDGKPASFLELLRASDLQPGTRRTKRQIDNALRDERNSWDRTP